MARVVVFGMRDCASLAHFYLRHDSDHEVAAFTVTRDFLPEDKAFEGKPVVTIRRPRGPFPSPGVPSAGSHLGASNESFSHGTSIVKRKSGATDSSVTLAVGRRSLPGTPIGDNCFILEDCTIQPMARIGNNVVIWSGSLIAHHCDGRRSRHAGAAAWRWAETVRSNPIVSSV